MADLELTLLTEELFLEDEEMLERELEFCDEDIALTELAIDDELISEDELIALEDELLTETELDTGNELPIEDNPTGELTFA